MNVSMVINYAIQCILNIWKSSDNNKKFIQYKFCCTLEKIEIMLF